ncbi:hypothetical protein MMPV_000247 [Pyropia vietnamensis]
MTAQLAALADALDDHGWEPSAAAAAVPGVPPAAVRRAAGLHFAAALRADRPLPWNAEALVAEAGRGAPPGEAEAVGGGDLAARAAAAMKEAEGGTLAAGTRVGAKGGGLKTAVGTPVSADGPAAVASTTPGGGVGGIDGVGGGGGHAPLFPATPPMAAAVPSEAASTAASNAATAATDGVVATLVGSAGAGAGAGLPPPADESLFSSWSLLPAGGGAALIGRPRSVTPSTDSGC